MRSNKLKVNCSNCSFQLKGTYCSNCGQKSTGKKTNWLDVFGALASGLLSMERGILATILEVIRKPKRTVEIYWSGGRFYYQSPGQMIFFVILILGIHILFVDSRILGFQVQLSNVPEAYRGFFNPQILFIALVLPFTALTSWVYFYRKKRTLPEHFIGAVYIFSTWAIVLTIFSDILSFFFDFRPELIVLAFLSLIFIWTSRLYSNRTAPIILVGNTVLQILVFIIILLLIFGVFLLFGIGNTNYSFNT